MADSVLFLGWSRAVAGREQQALNLFERSMAFYAKLQAGGRIESYEAVLLAAHGGDLNGFVLLRGDAGKLAELRRDDTFEEIVVEANYCLEGLGVVDGYVGQGLTNRFSQFAKLIRQ
jgi:hypothetical protein